MKFNWVTLRVKNLEESIKFYNELLNLEIASKFETDSSKIAMLGEKNGSKIELIEDENIIIENPGNGVSIGIGVKDFEKKIKELKEKNINVSDIVEPMENIKFCFIKDPNNYTVQIVEDN